MSFFVNNVELKEATFNQQKVKSIYFNTHLIWKVPWPAAGTPLNDWTWEEIINLCNSGEDVRQYFSIREMKNLVLTTGEVIPVAIGDFYHNTISGTADTAAIAFTFVECLNTKYKMNESETNQGGWEGCNMRKKHMPNILATFPAELTASNAIKYVDVLASAGSADTSVISSSDRLRLHSVTELNGIASYAAIEGTVYPYYESLSDLRKYVNDSSVNYWTRTPFTNNANSFQYHLHSHANRHFLGNNAAADFGVACAFDI